MAKKQADNHPINIINAITSDVYTDWYCERCGKEDNNRLLWEILDEGRPWCKCKEKGHPNAGYLDMVLSLIYQKYSLVHKIREKS
ncbi:hypothetical protein KAR91_73220 [Candidatus Pacearchaeota archaeon]|nr:hypothetical protein [Candidatus Pacearchaeota archaeon]